MNDNIQVTSEKKEENKKSVTKGNFFLLFFGFIIALVLISQLILWLFN